MTKLEKCARALFYTTNEWTQNHDLWESLPDYGQDLFYDRARACLTELMDVDDAMVEAGAAALSPYDDMADFRAKGIIIAMLRAVMEGK